MQAWIAQVEGTYLVVNILVINTFNRNRNKLFSVSDVVLEEDVVRSSYL